MSARREARGVAARRTSQNGVPECLSIGRCIEVWGDPSTEMVWASAVRRHSLARAYWVTTAGAQDEVQHIKGGAPYQASSAPHHLTRMGLTTDDLPRLTRDAVRLVRLAASADNQRSTRHHGASQGA